MASKPPPESLAHALAERGWRHQDLARVLRCERRTVTNWINGAVTPPGPARIAVATVLRLPVALVDGWYAAEPDAPEDAAVAGGG